MAAGRQFIVVVTATKDADSQGLSQVQFDKWSKVWYHVNVSDKCVDGAKR